MNEVKLSHCPVCGRRNTVPADVKSRKRLVESPIENFNWLTSCIKCYEQDCKFWRSSEGSKLEYSLTEEIKDLQSDLNHYLNELNKLQLYAEQLEYERKL